ncbi:Histone H1.0 [Parelaphostrongylus tenuis]|uniref:Histone H1.0 n=1 Tax=Parelaphostrongylus tenuis TaxID=148309 RepID=A0AAD5MF10_PARTN|nr:Histone H1.0 [Parelaphostrongylus tenuis]
MIEADPASGTTSQSSGTEDIKVFACRPDMFEDAPAPGSMSPSSATEDIKAFATTSPSSAAEDIKVFASCPDMLGADPASGTTSPSSATEDIKYSIGNAIKVEGEKKRRTSPRHPVYFEMIRSAIRALNDRRGASRQAILKYIAQKYKVPDNDRLINNRIRTALNRGLKNGLFKQATGSGAAGRIRLAEEPSREPALDVGKEPRVKSTKSKPKETADEYMYAELYCEQLNRVYDALKGMYSTQDEAKPLIAVKTEENFDELDEVEHKPQLAYSPDATPSDHGSVPLSGTLPECKPEPDI